MLKLRVSRLVALSREEYKSRAEQFGGFKQASDEEGKQNFMPPPPFGKNFPYAIKLLLIVQASSTSATVQ